MSHDIDKLVAERDRYRAALHRHLIRHASTAAINKFGGRLAFLTPLVEGQLAVREDGSNFHVVVVDRATGFERNGVTIADVLTDMRNSEDLSGAFDAKLNPAGELSGNPWSREGRNLTQQALLLKRNPPLAARYQREAQSS
jgi:hypothetical protein